MTIPNNMIQRCVSSLLRLIFLIQFYRNHHRICTESVEEKSNSKTLYGDQNPRRLPASKSWGFLLPRKSAAWYPAKIPKRISCWKVKVDKRGSPETKKRMYETSWLRMASWRFKLASYKAIRYIGTVPAITRGSGELPCGRRRSMYWETCWHLGGDLLTSDKSQGRLIKDSPLVIF